MNSKVSGKKSNFLYLVFTTILFSILILSCVQSVLAKDVAYIYKSKPMIDKNVLSIFDQLNLTYDLIPETKMPSNFTSYKFLYVGNERFSKNIPVNDYPVVITNYFFGERWGLTDRDGISRLAATDPLSVTIGNDILQVYTQARYNNKPISLPYYYLGNLNKVPAMQRIAGTYTGDTLDLGDVISYAPAGIHLINGKYTKGAMCFYGIVESKYWTQNARDLFLQCVNKVATTCSKDSDCPMNSTSDKYCMNLSVYQDTTTYSCINPGTVQSKCVSTKIPQKVQECPDLCKNGVCLGVVCKNDSQCGTTGLFGNLYCMNNSVFQDYVNFTCKNPGTENSYCSNSTSKQKNTDCLTNQQCTNGTCINVVCSKDLDCGTNGLLGNPFCNNNSVLQNHINFSCNFPGTILSYCTNLTYASLNFNCNSNQVCSNGNCGNVTCNKNSDCGTDNIFGNLFCLNNNVFNYFINYTCNNPGLANSYCSNSSGNHLNKICPSGQTCSNGQCVNIVCYNDSDCNDNLSNTEDHCINPGTVNSYCTHTNITCNKNLDCGTDGFLNQKYCKNNNSYDSYIHYQCNKPLTGQSYCSNTTTEVLVKICSKECTNGDCIECFNNLSCGTDGFIGNKYCTNGSVYQDYKQFSCLLAGTFNSSCSSNIFSKLVQTCPDNLCTNGTCAQIKCRKDSDCDDSNLTTVDYCNNPGTASSYCSHTPVNCVTNNDCGITGYIGSEACYSGDVFKNFQNSTCINAGTINSFCDIRVTSILLNDCGNNSCTDFGQNYCKNGNIYHSRTCTIRGCSNGACTSNLTTDEQIVNNCTNGCTDGACNNPPINCTKDNDCGVGVFLGNTFCQDNNVFQIIGATHCFNPSTIQSYCGILNNSVFKENCGSNYCDTHANKFCNGNDVYLNYTCYLKGCSSGACFNNKIYNQTYLSHCSDGCTNGQCNTPNITCYNDSSCDDNNLYTLDKCINPGTPSSYCSHTTYNCINDADCGITGYIGSELCSNNNVFKNFQNSVCKNPATVMSYCDISIAPKFLTDCGTDSCTDFGQNYCKNGNVYHSRTCTQKGCTNGACTSNLYTDEQIINNCPNGCTNGVCNNIPCYNDSGCGTNTFINGLFCSNNDVFQNFLTYTCNNPGTTSAYCSNLTVPTFKSDCGNNYCDTNTNKYCNGNDIYLNYTCYLKGCSSGNCFTNKFYNQTYSTHCDYGCTNGECNNPPINCTKDLDCGVGVFLGNTFCQDNNVFQIVGATHCFNPNTIQSYCGIQNSSVFKENCGSNYCDSYGNNYCKGNAIYKSQICYLKGCSNGACFNNNILNETFVNNCQYGCTNGLCNTPNITCYNDSGCDDNNLYTQDRCINPGTPSSYCSHTTYNCINDADCGITGYSGKEFCSGNNVFKNFQNSVCKNPSTVMSYCDISITPKFLTDCGTDSCTDFGQNYCKNGNVYHSKTCTQKGCSDGKCTTNIYNDEQIVNNCPNGCTNGECNNIPCYNNSQCGTDSFVNGLFCTNNDVFQNYQTYTCNNPGTTNAYCSNSLTPSFKTDCGNNYCDSYGNNYCKGSDLYKSQTCYLKGCSNGACFSNSVTNETFVSHCDNGCNNGACNNPPINCTKDLDCGVGVFLGNTFCQDNNVFQIIGATHCFNPNTIQSYCGILNSSVFKENCGSNYCDSYGNNYCKGSAIYKSQTYYLKGCSNGACFNNNNLNETFVTNCQYGCTNGLCNTPNITCYNDSGCNDQNSYTIDTCNNPGTASSYCSHTPVNCITNNDCGITGFLGKEYCSGNDVFKNFQNATCKNPSTINSYCDVLVQQINIINCGTDSCTDFGQNYCKNGNIYHSRTCTQKGCSDGKCTSNIYNDEQIVNNCPNGCTNGVCNNFNCYNNSQCGTDGFVNGLFCSNNNLFQNYVAYTCNFAGTPLAFCSNSATLTLKQNCGSNYCDPYGNNYCKGNDVYKIQTCYLKGCSTGSCFTNSVTNETYVSHCDNGCSNGQCNNPQINCTKDIDCGVGVFLGNTFCQDSNVFQIIGATHCFNPNTVQSYCGMINSSVFKQNCGNGECCTDFGNNYCKADGNLYHSQTCSNKGCSNGGCYNITNNNERIVESCSNGCSNNKCNNPANMSSYYITKTGPSVVTPGSTATYSIKVTNPTNENYRDVVISESVPNGFIFDPSQSSANCQLKNNNGVYTVGCSTFMSSSCLSKDCSRPMAPGSSVTFMITYKVPTTIPCDSMLSDKADLYAFAFMPIPTKYCLITGTEYYCSTLKSSSNFINTYVSCKKSC